MTYRQKCASILRAFGHHVVFVKGRRTSSFYTCTKCDRAFEYSIGKHNPKHQDVFAMNTNGNYDVEIYCSLDAPINRTAKETSSNYCPKYLAMI